MQINILRNKLVPWQERLSYYALQYNLENNYDEKIRDFFFENETYSAIKIFRKKSQIIKKSFQEPNYSSMYLVHIQSYRYFFRIHSSISHDPVVQIQHHDRSHKSKSLVSPSDEGIDSVKSCYRPRSIGKNSSYTGTSYNYALAWCVTTIHCCISPPSHNSSNHGLKNK